MPTEPLGGNLKERYKSKIRPELKGALNKKNIFEVPAVEKIVLNTSFGRLNPNEKAREQIAESLTKISGQKPIFTTAKKAIASFKIRKGQIIGAKVTLRGERMYHFLEKLVSIVLPRLRDFRGVSEESLDKRGNYTLGFREMIVFPEIEYSREETPVGLEVTIQTSAKTDEEAKKLLTDLGMPFRSDKTREEEFKMKPS